MRKELCTVGGRLFKVSHYGQALSEVRGGGGSGHLQNGPGIGPAYGVCRTYLCRRCFDVLIIPIQHTIGCEK